MLDKAKDIDIMVADLENNILSGLVLVLAVVFFAMDLRNAILVSMAFFSRCCSPSPSSM